VEGALHNVVVIGKEMVIIWQMMSQLIRGIACRFLYGKGGDI